MSKRTGSIVSSFIFVVVLLVASGLGFAQTLGGITGVVTDAGGAVIPGATVTAVGEQTGLKRVQTSSSQASTTSQIFQSARTR